MDSAQPPTLTLPLAPSLERRRLQCYLALLLGDVLTIFAGFGGAGYAYLGWQGMADASLQAQLLTPIFLTIALYNGSYSMGVLANAGQGALRGLVALAISATVVVFIAFYTKSSAEFSRFAFTLGIGLTSLFLFWTRFLMRDFVRWRCGERVLNELTILDGGPQVALPGAFRLSASEYGLVPDLSDPHALDRIGLVLRNIDRVSVSCPPERRAAWALILKGANVDGEVLDDSVLAIGAHGAREAGGHGWLEVSAGPLGLRSRLMKRLLDTGLSAMALVALAPLMLIVALAILIEDGRPVLFTQRRLGRGNRFFAMIKFRSMANARSDGDGLQSTQRDDVRITAVGKFIRRTSIDELPQLFNVVRGDMSLVGPRPHAIGSQAGDKLFWEVDTRYWLRHSLKPGMSGLAQVRGLRGATELESDLASRLQSDLEYVEGWTIWRDVRIIALTLRVLVHERAF